MPEFNLKGLLEASEKLALPWRLGIWAIVTGALALVVIQFSYPEDLSKPVRLVIVIAGGAVLLIILLFTPRTHKWYETMPKEEPVECKSIMFHALGSQSTEKKVLIHYYEHNVIKSGAFSPDVEKQRQLGVSGWAFDRILLYLYEESKAPGDLSLRFDHIKIEKEKLDQAGWKNSVFPLHYAVRSAKVAIERAGNTPKCSLTHRQVIEQVQNELNTIPARACRSLGLHYRGDQIYDACVYILANTVGL